MAPSAYLEPILRSAEDEEDDTEAMVRNLKGGSYQSWPNEAGFDGLREEQSPIELNVVGAIPNWAAGVLYRTGPGIYKVEDTPKGTFFATHWFDGLAQTHRFEIIADTEDSSCRVLYSSRRQCEAVINHIKQHGDRSGTSFAQRRDPCIGLFGKFMSAWEAARPREEKKNMENICVTVLADLPGFDKTPLLPLSDGSPKPAAKRHGRIAGEAGHRANKSRDLWLLTDISTLQKVDAQTLEPIGYAKQQMLHPDLRGHISCAHAQRDPETGDIFNFNAELGRLATYRIFRVSKSTGKTDILATIQRPDVKAAYIHSLYLSPSFVVLCVPSTHLGLNGLKVLWERNIMDAIEPFDPANKCRWFVVDRLHGRGVVAEFETDAGFFFHTVNAFEERDEADARGRTVSLFCDVVEYVNHDVMFGLYYDVLLQKNRAAEKLWGAEARVRNCVAGLARYRFRVPAPAPAPAAEGSRAGRVGAGGSGPAVPTSVDRLFSIPGPHSGELPTINPLFATKRQRYVYSLPTRGLSTLTDTLAKTDLDTREVLYWNNPRGHTPGEAIFVPRPGGVAEDDGVLLSVVLDGDGASSYLICLDAATMKEVGRAEVGFAVAFGFHGVHCSS